jgi:hypothetical protein
MSEAPKIYIVVMRQTRMWLVGPFASQTEAGTWGRHNNPEDDPRWQTIELDIAQVVSPLRVLSPSAGPMQEGA